MLPPETLISADAAASAADPVPVTSIQRRHWTVRVLAGGQPALPASAYLGSAYLGTVGCGLQDVDPGPEAAVARIRLKESPAAAHLALGMALGFFLPASDPSPRESPGRDASRPQAWRSARKSCPDCAAAGDLQDHRWQAARR